MVQCDWIDHFLMPLGVGRFGGNTYAVATFTLSGASGKQMDGPCLWLACAE